MLIEKEEIETILPHRGKMMLLSRVTDYHISGKVRAEYDITQSCLFYDAEAGGVPSWVGFEFMAQTISAYSGLRDREGIKPKIGFILSVPSIEIYVPLFTAGKPVDIYMEMIDRVDLVYTFEGYILYEGKKAMEGKIMVMEIDENDEKYKLFIDKEK